LKWKVTRGKKEERTVPPVVRGFKRMMAETNHKKRKVRSDGLKSGSERGGVSCKGLFTENQSRGVKKLQKRKPGCTRGGISLKSDLRKHHDDQRGIWEEGGRWKGKKKGIAQGFKKKNWINRRGPIKKGFLGP